MSTLKNLRGNNLNFPARRRQVKGQLQCLTAARDDASLTISGVSSKRQNGHDFLHSGMMERFLLGFLSGAVGKCLSGGRSITSLIHLAEIRF